jgi:hypothetical protein
MLYGFTAIFHLLLYWFTAILEYLNSSSWSPDNEYLITTCTFLSFSLTSLSHTHSSSWSPDNEYLITGGEDDLVVVST